MLRKIIIQNYALIDELELAFGSGLNIITGETGAGKSIIIGALGLVLGNRADTGVLGDKERKCIVEAVFDMPAFLRPLFEKHDLDIEEQIIIRRQINPNGKSRAFINDTPVKLPLIKEVAASLIDVNTQFQTYRLSDAQEQLRMLDTYAGLTDLSKQYTDDYSAWRKLVNELADIEQKEQKLLSERDFLQFQFDELEQARLQKGEYRQLEQELEILANAEEIKSALYAASNLLSNDETSVLDALMQSAALVRKLTNYHKDYEELNTRLQSVIVELQDINDALETKADEVEFNPGRLEELNDRIDLINHLLQKHGLQEADQLIDLQSRLEEQLLSFEQIESNKEDLKKKIAAYFDKIAEEADKLSELRHKVLNEVAQKVKKRLAQLGMKSADFKIAMEKLEQPEQNGKDRLQFLFSANKGVEVAPIAKVASGGEMSRLMLTLVSILSTKRSLGSIVFDEIDTGVSGEVAAMVGKLMKEMGRKMQLIAITHLPQIAAMADRHYRVYKYEEQERSYSGIVQLSEEERVAEISQMISGKRKTDAAIKTAKELMGI